MEFIAKIETAQQSNIQEIASTLERMGIHIKQILRLTGTITGNSTLPLNQLKIKGIQSVEQARSVRSI